MRNDETWGTTEREERRKPTTFRTYRTYLTYLTFLTACSATGDKQAAKPDWSRVPVAVELRLAHGASG
ncbi:MAG TPA: hypothetical protein VK899_04980, partial [Gemmatimonadales bacterium]|nr:hypothetical protein [Gemmatimonadales bacterium]